MPLRALVKTPAFTTTVVLTLALGIGANSAVFSAIYAVLLRPLPFPASDQLVTVGQSQSKIPQPFMAPVRLEDWNRLNNTFTAIAGYYTEDTSETSGELPERLRRAWVTPRFLRVMGVSPALGRDFSPRPSDGIWSNLAILICRRRRSAALLAMRVRQAWTTNLRPPPIDAMVRCSRERFS
jgi:hypothetical protein